MIFGCKKSPEKDMGEGRAQHSLTPHGREQRLQILFLADQWVSGAADSVCSGSDGSGCGRRQSLCRNGIRSHEYSDGGHVDIPERLRDLESARIPPGRVETGSRIHRVA